MEIKRMPNIALTIDEFFDMEDQEFAHGGEAVIFKTGNPNTLYKFFKDHNGNYIDMSDNKFKKLYYTSVTKGDMNLDEKELELMKKVSDETITDYGIDNQDYIVVDSLMSAIYDLMYEVEHYKEEAEDLKHRMESYYELKKEWRDDYE